MNFSCNLAAPLIKDIYNMRTRLLFLLSLLSILILECSIAQVGKIHGRATIDSQYTLQKAQLDSAFKVIDELKQAQARSKDYDGLLEKTNNQLSLWWNPYGVLIAFIGVLFAILAIIVTFGLYRQSREYRTLIQDSITNYQAILNKFIEEKNYELDKKIKDAETSAAAATGDARNTIEQELADFRRQKELISQQSITGFAYTAPPSGSIINPSLSGVAYAGPGPYVMHEKVVSCSNCKKEFTVKKLVSGLFLSTNPSKVKCPHCQHENMVTL